MNGVAGCNRRRRLQVRIAKVAAFSIRAAVAHRMLDRRGSAGIPAGVWRAGATTTEKRNQTRRAGTRRQPTPSRAAAVSLGQALRRTGVGAPIAKLLGIFTPSSACRYWSHRRCPAQASQYGKGRLRAVALGGSCCRRPAFRQCLKSPVSGTDGPTRSAGCVSVMALGPTRDNRSIWAASCLLSGAAASWDGAK